jgi:hypothetical protein
VGSRRAKISSLRFTCGIFVDVDFAGRAQRGS